MQHGHCSVHSFSFAIITAPGTCIILDSTCITGRCIMPQKFLDLLVVLESKQIFVRMCILPTVLLKG